MASLYKRPNSPYWWIKFVNAAGQTTRESTGFRIGIGLDTQRARQLRDQRTFEESQRGKATSAEIWTAWVDTFFQLRYADSAATLLRARNAWRMLAMFLAELKIERPRQLTRDHCIAYMAWRKKPNRKERKYRASHNTAQLELKILGIIMAEAVARGYAPFNPCRDLHIKRLPVARQNKKPALTPEAVAFLREQIQAEQRLYTPEGDGEPVPLRTFLNNSFEIGYYHGVRLSETYLDPMRDVEFFNRSKTGDRAARITFNAKGRKEHTVLLHPKLIPLFDALRQQRKTETYPKPKSPAKEWSNFIRRTGLNKEFPHVCFHSLRVTAATEMARKGVSKKKAMEYLGHASSTVHDIYVRLQPEDLDDCAAAIE